MAIAGVARGVKEGTPMNATGNMTFRRLDEEPLVEDDASPALSSPSELGARVWYAFDRWLSVARSSSDDDFVLA